MGVRVLQRKNAYENFLLGMKCMFNWLKSDKKAWQRLKKQVNEYFLFNPLTDFACKVNFFSAKID